MRQFGRFYAHGIILVLGMWQLFWFGPSPTTYATLLDTTKPTALSCISILCIVNCRAPLETCHNYSYLSYFNIQFLSFPSLPSSQYITLTLLLFFRLLLCCILFSRNNNNKYSHLHCHHLVFLIKPI